MILKDKKKKKVLNTDNFAKLTKILELEDFAIENHKRLVTNTKILKNEIQIDNHMLKKVLAEYPGMYGWAIVENILIHKIYDEKNEVYENKMKVWFDLVSSRKGFEKASQKKVDVTIYSEHPARIDEMKAEIRDLKYKCDISAGMVKVWANAINSLQSLSKQVVEEMAMTRIGLTAKGGGK